MRWLISSFVLLFFALPNFADDASVMYVNYFGEYVSESSYDISIDGTSSMATILEALNQARGNHCSLCGDSGRGGVTSDLAIIGYGEGDSDDFFAATEDIQNTIPLAQVLPRRPRYQEGARWYIYFVDSAYSQYVRNKKPVFGMSPFRFLAQVGLQDLQYFPTPK